MEIEGAVYQIYMYCVVSTHSNVLQGALTDMIVVSCMSS